MTKKYDHQFDDIHVVDTRTNRDGSRSREPVEVLHELHLSHRRFLRPEAHFVCALPDDFARGDQSLHVDHLCVIRSPEGFQGLS